MDCYSEKGNLTSRIKVKYYFNIVYAYDKTHHIFS